MIKKVKISFFVGLAIVLLHSCVFSMKQKPCNPGLTIIDHATSSDCQAGDDCWKNTWRNGVLMNAGLVRNSPKKFENLLCNVLLEKPDSFSIDEYQAILDRLLQAIDTDLKFVSAMIEIARAEGHGYVVEFLNQSMQCL